jgi:hypothetical protein
MIGYVHNADQQFHINGLHLSGISSVNASYNIPTEDNDFLGYVGSAEFMQTAPGVATFSFDRSMVTTDEPITELIGLEEGFDGGLTFNGKNFNFQSGYINSYQCSFSVDNVPESSVSINAFGEVGPEVEIKKNAENQKNLFIVANSGIKVECGGRETNRVLSFSFSTSISNKPVYKIGSIYPCEVVLGTPLKQSFNIEMEIDQFDSRNVYDYMRTGIHSETIRVTLKNKCEEEGEVVYTFKNAHLISQSLNTDAENNTKVELSYSTVSRDKPEISYV